MIEKILEKENIKSNNIKKSNSGFTNQVYFVDDYVIKFTNNPKSFQMLEKEISIYKNITLSYIPKYIASGIIEDYKYLIISKISGSPLYSIWHTLNKEIKITILHKITNILKEFHKINGDFLDKYFNHIDWSKYIIDQLNKRAKSLHELGFNTKKLNIFINNEVNELFRDNKFGLIYNDAHFDNFIFDGENVFLIDFDRVIYAPLDYEMLIFKTMCDIPDKFANEIDYINCKKEDYDFLYEEFKKEYPEMFDIKTEKRIEIYQFNYLIKQAIESKNREYIELLLEKYNFK